MIAGRGLAAVDHVHYAPGLHWMYDRAERRWFDPYDLCRWGGAGLVRVLYWLDRATDWLYNVAAVRVAAWVGSAVSAAHTGSHAM